MMRRREAEFVERLLRRLEPARCLEWGMGRSTLWFPSFLQPEALWVSVEHNEDWYEIVHARLRREKTALLLVPPSDPSWSPPAEGTRREFLDYVEAPAEYAPFDFILVDGRARAACLEEARNWLSDRGVILLHDANRRYLHDSATGYPHEFFFLDYRPNAGGIWVGSNREDLGELVEANTEAPLWSLLEQHGHYLRL